MMNQGGSFSPQDRHHSGEMQTGQIMQGYRSPENVIELTPDELKILKECQRNSVLHRGLPLGLVTYGGIHYLMKAGLMKRSKFSLILGGITGFVMGTMSYRGVCVEKLMALPNSTLKERILIAQGEQPHVRVEVQPQEQSWFDSTTPSEPMTSPYDMEPYHQRNQFDDYAARPDPDSAYAVNPPLQPTVGIPYTTYDDLRRNNREQYEKSRDYGYRTPNNNDNMRHTQSGPVPPSRDYGPNAPMPPYEPRLDDPMALPPRRSDDFMS